jgi:diguanylate cyclase (GGDEF)-like protein
MMNKPAEKNNGTNSVRAIAIISVLLMIVLVVVLFLTIRNDNDQKKILEASIEQQLIASSIAARDMIDPALVAAINTPEDIAQNQTAYNQTLVKLRTLRDEVGATYIYVLKEIDGEVYFILDTDEQTADILGDPYELSRVHELAFLGLIGADILNVVDEWGSFNTGAVPIFKGGEVVGIVSTDIEDAFLQRSINAANLNLFILIATLIIILGVLLAVIVILLRRVSRMQQKLFRSANYDTITRLPNRNYLFSYLAKNSQDTLFTASPFALLFIDLDNFKSVNDSAGHDAGDVLLHSIAVFLEKSGAAFAARHPDAVWTSLTARIGGDEFLQILPGVASPDEAAQLAQELLDDFAQEEPLRQFIEDFSVGMSIGIALFSTDSADYDELIRFADVAMYHAKAAGKNRYALFTPEMNEDTEHLELTVRGDRGKR